MAALQLQELILNHQFQKKWSIVSNSKMLLRLKTDPTFYATMVSYARRVGGKNINDTCSRIMQLILTRNFVLQLNRPGTHGKIAFLPLEPFIADVIRSIHPSATDSVVEACIISNLKNGRDWDGARSLRNKNCK